MTTIILLHGIGGDIWGPVLPAFASSEILAWDLPGYGGAPMLPEITFPAMAAALRDRLDADCIPRIDLIGHSIGGMLAQEFALAYPARVRSLVLYATTPAFGGRDPAFAEQFLAERLAPLETGGGMAELAAEMPGMLGPHAPDGAAGTAVAAMAAVPQDAYRAMVACLTTFDRRADTARIAPPTLLITGDRDPLAPPRIMERMRDAIRGSRLVVLPDAGHLAHLEQPAAFGAAVKGFLAAVREG